MSQKKSEGLKPFYDDSNKGDSNEKTSVSSSQFDEEASVDE